MKIERVRLCNLASLAGEWEVRFDVPSYYESGIFLISGRTGSGKSTLLDAICLALYYKTPRINSTQDIRQIVTHKQKYAFAEVVFTVANQRYRSRYTYFKGGKSGKAKTDTDELHLENLTTRKSLIDNPANAKKSHEREIQRLVGLDFKQFRQSILLAQGEFASFLTADPKERANILEALADSTIYSAISKKTYELYTEQLKEIKELEAKLGVSSNEHQQQENPAAKLKELTNHLETLEGILKANTVTCDRLSKEIIALQAWQQLASDIALKNTELSSLEQQLREYEQQQQLAQRAKDQLEQDQQQERKVLMVRRELISKFQVLNQQLLVKGRQKAQKEHDVAEVQGLLQQAQENALMFKRTYDDQYALLHDKYSDDQLLIFSRDSALLLTQLQRKVEEYQLAWQNWQPQLVLWSEYQEVNQQLSIVKYEEHNYQLVKGQLYVKRLELIHQELVAIEQQELLLQERMQLARQKSSSLEEERLFTNTTLKLFEERDKLELGKPCLLCGQVVMDLPAVDIKSKQEVVQRLAIINNTIKEQQLAIDQLQHEIHELDRNKGNLTENKQSLTHNTTDILTALQLNSLESPLSVEQLEVQYMQLKEHRQLLIDISKYDQVKLQYEQLMECERQLITSATQLALLLGHGALEVRDDAMIDVIIDEAKTLTMQLTQLDQQKATVETHDQLVIKQQERLIEIEKQVQQYQVDYDEAEREISPLQEQLTQGLSSLDEVDKRFDQLDQDKSECVALLDTATKRTNNLDKTVVLVKEQLKVLEQQQAEQLMILELEQDTIKSQYPQLLDTRQQDLSQAQALLYTHEQQKSDLTQELGYSKSQLEQYEKRAQEIIVYTQKLDQANALHLPYQHLKELIGSADGNKFKVFAQALTFDRVVAAANDYLKLIQDRYLIQRKVDSDEDLAFGVVDQFQADLLRPIQTLSGGERFIISLSLALGLASLASQKIQVDSLFLDEGFGTLDTHSLELVLDALTSLRERGKVVGVISHVELLKERISSKIEVISIGKGASKLVGEGVKYSPQQSTKVVGELF